MDRRGAIHRMGLMLGATVSIPTVSALLSGCHAPPEPYLPRILSQAQFDFVGRVAEIILPETETPGARSAGVNRFIDTLLAEYYPGQERQAFVHALHAFEVGITPEGPVTAHQIGPVDEAAYQIPMRHRSEGDPFDQDQFFRRFKELTVAGFYTSEVGATLELTPNPMGVWRADVPMAEIGRTWS